MLMQVHSFCFAVDISADITNLHFLVVGYFINIHNIFFVFISLE